MKMYRLWLAGIALVGLAAQAISEQVGVNTPSESLTVQRIQSLPIELRGPWLRYIRQSELQRQADHKHLEKERRHLLPGDVAEPKHSNSASSIPLNRSMEWYGGQDAQHIARVICSFQTPAGGWSKNIDMSGELRRPGMAYAANNQSQHLGMDDFDKPKDPQWNYVGTIDNDATTTQLRFLARVIHMDPQEKAFQRAFAKGIQYLIRAQYPNGGWPQVWPLEGGYHDAITLNDDAMTQVMDLMHHVAMGEGEYDFVSPSLQAKAGRAFQRGVQCLLAGQMREEGHRTIWPQQLDALTLMPVSARNFEIPVPCSAESAEVLLLMMEDIPSPDKDVQTAIRSGVDYLQMVAIHGHKWTRGSDGHMLVEDSSSPWLWARYYSIETHRAIFADRDKSIHDRVEEISRERRDGYGWFTNAPARALEQFAIWNKEHPEHR